MIYRDIRCFMLGLTTTISFCSKNVTITTNISLCCKKCYNKCDISFHVTMLTCKHQKHCSDNCDKYLSKKLILFFSTHVSSDIVVTTVINIYQIKVNIIIFLYKCE